MCIKSNDSLERCGLEGNEMRFFLAKGQILHKVDWSILTTGVFKSLEIA